MIEAYPLDWPLDYRRTPDAKRKKSQFKTTLGAARDFLKDEIRRLNAKDLIISTNIPLKTNGDLYADWSRYKISDPGVAVFFKWKEKDIVMCCDTYSSIWENIAAVGKSIEAIRAMERWGCSDFIERAFTGFKQLPAPGENFWKILGISETRNVTEITTKYREKAFIHHPDRGGNADEFAKLTRAYESALAYANLY